jgi:lipopolysaccharide transport system permease protein
MNSIGLHWYQIKILTLANMKARYRKTFMGFVWVILNPILMYSVQAIVFKKFLQINHPDYYLFLLGGLLPWIFINSSIDSCSNSIVTASSIIKSFQVSPLVLVASAILDNAINFLAGFILVLIPTLILSQKISSSLLLLPISLLILLLFTASITITLALLQVFYRDMKYVTNFLMSVLFFLTPIFYPPHYIPADFQWIIDINPIYLVIVPFRSCINGGSVEEIIYMLIRGLFLSLISILILKKLWKKKKNELFLKL